jgi:GTP-binding protein YchF
MEFGIVGLELSGKTTLFSLLTGHQPGAAGGKREAHVGTAQVPDPRLDRLTAMYHPKKHTPAVVRFVDIPGITKGSGQSMNLPELKTMDGLAAVVRAFGSEAIPHPEGDVNPARDLDLLETEFLLSDLSIATNRLEKLGKEMQKRKAPELTAERNAVEKCRLAVDAGTPLRQIDLTPEEKKILRGFTFLTLKPLLVILNVGEEEAGDLVGAVKRAGFGKWDGAPGVAFSVVCAPLEQEISQMSPDEQAEFLKGMGLPDRALDRLLRAAYSLLGLISFLTAGEDECRAWSIPAGTSAVRAAGAIHTDIEKGFIRAEVVPFQTLIEAGSLAVCKTHGSLRLEGKEYVVQDGDVINFRHSG